jgi:hypothetical protein
MKQRCAMLFALEHVGKLGGGNKDFLTHAWLLCAEFALLRNLGALAMTVPAIPLARRAAATVCAVMQSTAFSFRH